MLFYRRLRYGYTFRRIPLTQGQYAIVDPDDYHRLSKHKWYASGQRNQRFYAVRREPKKNGIRGKIVHMHREVANTPEGMLCDHINGRTLDNRKANLRPATCSQNMWNSRKPSRPGYSKYKGISFDKKRRKWVAKLSVHCRSIYLGSFDDEIQAAKAYDKAAKKHFGQFARLNFKE